MNRLLLTISIVLGLAAGGAIYAAGDDDPLLDAIKARQGIMKNYDWNVGPLFGMAKGDIEYNAESAAAYANNLKALVSLDNGSQWPEGTDDEEYPDDTRAFPEIWLSYPDINEKDQVLTDAAIALAEVAGNGLDALQSSIGDVGEACKGCHDDFRGKFE